MDFLFPNPCYTSSSALPAVAVRAPSVCLISARLAIVTILATLILAFGMSMDSFAAALSKGACLKHPTVKEAVRIGIIFGAIEFVTPLLGWALGYAASSYVMAWDHWIIFGLLSLLGGRMIIAGLNNDNGADCSPPERHGIMVLVLTAIATSLDALAVGVGLAFLQVNILATSLLIGLMTAIMATAGVILGRFIGPILGRWSEILGGLLLIGIGTTILLQHLGFLS